MIKPGLSAARVQIHLDVHDEPIELVELTLAFQAIAYEYKRFLGQHLVAGGGSSDDGDVKLYVTKIENNCIEAELAGAAMIMGQYFAVMEYVNVFVEFTKNIRSAIDFFIGLAKLPTLDPKKIPYSKKECRRIADIVEIAAKNKNGKLGLNVIEYAEESKTAKVHLKIDFTSEQAYEAKRGALLAEKALEYRGEADHKKVLMQLFQTNADDPKSQGRTGLRAIIKSVSSKALPVYFVSELDQQKIAFINQDPATNPLRASYVVDVNVETDKDDVPRFYRVVHVHDIIPGDA